MATEDRLREYLKRVTVDLTETRRQLAELTDTQREPIAVVGMACRFPGGGDTVEGFWDLLCSGRGTAGEVPADRWNIDDHYQPDRSVPGAVYTKLGSFLPDIAGWDAEFFGTPPREALRMDPAQRLLMELVCDGLDNAGIAADRLAGSRTAVLVGLMDPLQYGRLAVDRQGVQIANDPYWGQGASASVAAGRLAYHFDLRGPALTLDTACSSSLVGVHLAMAALRRGECDLAIAAGTFLIMHPDMYRQGCATAMLAADGRCKTFDAKADGYLIGEGGGLVVLERLSSAQRANRRIRAVLCGSAVNSDGRSNGLTAPSRAAQVAVITSALAAARVDPDDVDYLEAHGSGTPLGDGIELSALHDVFGRRPAGRPLRIGAVKTNIGHTQSAAGIAGLVKTVLVLEHGVAPANLHLTEPSTAIPADGSLAPVREPVAVGGADRPVLAGVSSFGWSGTNAHVVLAAAPAVSPAASPPAAAYHLPVSAASAAALRATCAELAEAVRARPALDLTDLAHTLVVGRSAHDHRRVLTVTDRATAVAALTEAATGPLPPRARNRPRVAFLLPGTGDQYAGLGRELYAAEPVYAAAVDECVRIAAQRCGIDLRPVLFPPDRPTGGGADLAALLGRTEAEADTTDTSAEIAHPFLFTVQYALAKLLAHWGVTPDVLVGYSLGEYVGACLAGVFTLPDALYLVVERARLIAAVPAGRMIAVAGDEPTARSAIADSGADVDVAAINGPAMTVLSGAGDQLDLVAARLTEADIVWRPLRTAHAFHSALLAPARDKLAGLLDQIPRRPPAVAIVSNRTGGVLSASAATGSAHWADHLVDPVRFADGVRHCVADGVDVFVELGAGQTLGGLVRQNLTGATGVSVLGTLAASWAERTEPRTALLASCARLWELGVPVDWAATGSGAGRIVTLPSYPFQRTPFWPEHTVPTRPATAPAGPAVNLGYAPVWRRDPVPPAATPAGPLLVFADATVGPELAGLVAAAGGAVLEVVPGSALHRDGRRFTIDPAQPAHYRAVLAAVADEFPAAEPVRIVHLWSLLAGCATPGQPTEAELWDAVRLGCDSLLLTLRELGGVADPRLVTVSLGARDVVGGDAVAPQRAIGHGLLMSARHEFPGLGWHAVDLDRADQRAAGQLLRELAVRPAGPAPVAVAWRGNRRWLADWAELAPPTEPDQPVWRRDGVYLITGGTRGLGRALARHLVNAGVRRLALVSRSGIADTHELTEAGAEVLVLRADAGQPERLRAAVRAARTHFGRLTGVLHVAGVPASGMIARTSPESAATVLAPKVLAMAVLAELVGPATPPDQRPELLVLYSSAITTFGGIGEADYCAANTVLDAYGAALAASAPDTRVLTVSWGPWQHDDWQAGAGSDLADRAAAYRARHGFPEEAGHALLDELLRTGVGHAIALRQPLPDVLREWTGLLDLTALVGSSTPGAGERFPRPALRTGFVAPRGELEAVIAEIWGDFLGIDGVGVHDPFFDLGGNSLVGTAMVRAVEGRLGTSIAPALLFAHPTVARFAEALAHADTDPAADQLGTSAARGQRRRRARPGTRK